MLEPFNIVYAFITFEQESDKMTCLDEYVPYFNFFRSERTRFRVHPREDGKGDTFHYLRVAQAVEASDIMWENMANVGWKQYFVRRAITTIAILGLLIGNIILVVFATDWVKSGGRLLVNCGDLFVSGASDNMYCPCDLEHQRKQSRNRFGIDFERQLPKTSRELRLQPIHRVGNVVV